jgi:diacylglycerol kinase (ATP)
VRRWALVFNPSSGSSGDEVDEVVRSTLAEQVDVHVVRSADADSFDDGVRAAARAVEVVVAAGGDGTLNWVLNALGDSLSEVTLGLVPMGTGNDFARTLGLPEDPREAARTLLGAEERTLDVARATGAGADRLFINACMGGFPVQANEAIDEDVKKRFGALAFWLGGAKALTELTRAKVTVNGRAIEDCVAVGVGNGRTCGGGLEVWPSARPDDGALDGCVLAASGIPQALMLAAKVKSATHEELDGVVTLRDATIEIDADPAIEFNVDGELPGLRSPATFRIAGRVRFLTPRHSH